MRLSLQAYRTNEWMVEVLDYDEDMRIFAYGSMRSDHRPACGLVGEPSGGKRWTERIDAAWNHFGLRHSAAAVAKQWHVGSRESLVVSQLGQALLPIEQGDQRVSECPQSRNVREASLQRYFQFQEVHFEPGSHAEWGSWLVDHVETRSDVELVGGKSSIFQALEMLAGNESGGSPSEMSAQ